MTIRIEYDIDDGSLVIRGEDEDGDEQVVEFVPRDGPDDVRRLLAILEGNEVAFDFEEMG